MTELNVRHKLEYIPAKLRIPFMEEVYRILAPGGRATFLTLYWSSWRAIFDPELEWPPIVEQFYAIILNKAWREQEKRPPLKCDFEFVGYGYDWEQEVAVRQSETQAFWGKRYLNSINDLQVVLMKRAKEK